MAFINTALERYSVRKFSSRPVEQAKIDSILLAAQHAPTACNKQPQKITVLQSAAALEKLQNCKPFRFGETLAFLVCYDKTLCWQRACDGKLSGEIDASIVATHMILEAWEQGIGSTWVMVFDPEAVRAEFALPENEVPVCLLLMGYAASDAVPADFHLQKKPLSDTVRYL